MDRVPAGVNALLALLSNPYRRTDALQLMETAKDTTQRPPIRNLAILALEHLILRLPNDDLEEFDALLVALGLKPRSGPGVPLNASLLQEGYTTTDLRAFIPQFRRRLQRLRRIHDRLRRQGNCADAPADSLHLAQQECKLTLGRYLIAPEEVVGRIRALLNCSRGLPEPLAGVSPRVQEEADRVLARLPGFEAAIARGLCASSEIYWNTPATPSSLNAPVESPLTTVVTVIKPPGSDLEFEIKRTGLRPGPLLDVLYRRNGKPVPAAHRLQGGSMGSLLIHEAKAAAILAHLYRLVHAREAPISRLLAMKSVYALPAAQGETQLVDYFTDAEGYGPGFERMRAAMGEAVAAFDKDSGAPPLEIPGALGLSSRFLAHVAPRQGIFAHTSSYRLDRLALYLSPDGPRAYFTDGLAHSRQEARRFTDDVLDEILGVYTPPETGYRDHSRYLDEAFGKPDNRIRADRHFSAAMGQIGCLWGTLLAARGHSTGESFVARNVGLKSVWEDGDWRVRLLFMDHDNLHIGHPQPDFHPLETLEGMACDGVYIFGWGIDIEGSVGSLEAIYRAPPELSRQGRRRLFRAARSAYRATQAAILSEPEVQQYFHPAFVNRLRDWDRILKGYFQRAETGWEADTRRRLSERDYSPELIDEHVEAAGRYALRLPQLEQVL